MKKRKLKVVLYAPRAWKLHGLAQCHDCKWTDNSYNAMKRGWQHAAETGHSVIAETAYAQLYNPRK